MSTGSESQGQMYDLVLERIVPVPPEKLWLAWTQEEHIKQWFTPAPWKTVECEIDLRPGGRFNTIMEAPEGDRFPSNGCFLEIVPNRRLVFTDILGENFRPLELEGDVHFTAAVSFEPTADGRGTRYVAHAMHATENSRRKHEEMGFHDGWGKALDQLAAYASTL